MMKKLLYSLLLLSAFQVPSFAQRPAWYQPYADTSIWNSPIGDGANYTAPIGLNFGDEFAFQDVEYHFRGLNKDPLTDTSSYAGWIRFPFYGTPNLSTGGAPNNPFSYIHPDETTVWQSQYWTRNGDGGSLNLSANMQVGTSGNWNNIRVNSGGDESIWGTHGGTQMQALGGSIRKGEVTSGDDPGNVNDGNVHSIRHALKLNINGARYFYNGIPNGEGRKGFGYRWPAFTADADAQWHYGGTNPEVAAGSLLAIPRNVDLNTLGLQTRAGKKLAWTAKNFGIYLVDSSGWGAHELSMERGVLQELQVHHWEFNGGLPSAVGSDMMKIYSRLCVVTNNSPSNPGGPGNRLTNRAGTLAGANNVPNGDYLIRSKRSGLYLGIPDNRTENGAPVVQLTHTGASNQVWTISHYGNGYYTLRAKHSGKGMDVSGVSLNDQAPLTQWDVAGAPGDNQLWTLVPVGNGWYYIEARHSFKVIDVPNWSTSSGQQMQQYTYGGFDAQLWRLEAAGGAGGGGIVSGMVYRFRPSHTSGVSMDVFGGPGAGSGSRVGIYNNHSDSNQKWLVTDVGNGNYELTPQSQTGTRLDAFGQYNGGEIGIWNANGGNNQRWKLVLQGDGRYKIQAAFNTSLVLSVENSGGSGVPLKVLNDSGAASQLWHVEVP